MFDSNVLTEKITGIPGSLFECDPVPCFVVNWKQSQVCPKVDLCPYTEREWSKASGSGPPSPRRYVCCWMWEWPMGQVENFLFVKTLSGRRRRCLHHWICDLLLSADGSRRNLDLSELGRASWECFAMGHLETQTDKLKGSGTQIDGLFVCLHLIEVSLGKM